MFNAKRPITDCILSDKSSSVKQNQDQQILSIDLTIYMEEKEKKISKRDIQVCTIDQNNNE